MNAARVPLVDLAAHNAPFTEAFTARLRDACATGQFVLGPDVSAFEEEFASAVGWPYAVAVSSGTDALVCALRLAGVGRDAEVITTPFTFAATAEAILRVGAVPVFVDVRPTDLNLDPEAVSDAVTPRTRAVLAVHLFGRCAAVVKLDAICRKHDLALIEDAAQAVGAPRHEGVRSLQCHSFFPAKPLGALGDGGAVCCETEAQAKELRSLRVHGAQRRGWHERLGGNFRLDAIQAAWLRVKLPHLADYLTRRREHARAYDAAFADLPGLSLLSPGYGSPDAVASYYTLRSTDRDGLKEHLSRRDIAAAVYYDTPLHHQPLCAGAAPSGALPEAERAAEEVLTLPLFPEMTSDQRGCVIDAVRTFCEQHPLDR